VTLDLLEIFANNIVPILMVAGVGFALAQFFPDLVEPLGQVSFHAFMPALIFSIISQSDVGGAEFGLLFGGNMAYQVMMMGLAGAVFYKTDAKDRAVGVLGAGCQNCGNLGLSVIGFAFSEAVLARAVIIFTSNMVTNNTIGVYVASSGTRSPVQAAMRAIKSPVPVTLLFAILFRASGIATPTIIARPIELLAGAAIPTILVLLGAQVARAERISHIRLISVAVMLRLLVGPSIGFALAALLSFSGGARTAFILQASMPTAVMTIILATEYHLNTELMSNIILISLLLSPLTLTPLILYFQ
jgi:predicted permease